MPTLKKSRIVDLLINEQKVIDALTILKLNINSSSKVVNNDFHKKKSAFQNTYRHSHYGTLNKIRKYYPIIDEEIKSVSPQRVYKNYIARVLSPYDEEPVKIENNRWAFKEYMYDVSGHYSDKQIRLLILEDFDKERRYFEKLKVKFDEPRVIESSYNRPRIPEKIRIEVWRRDGGKCARCGSREKLEYDHIVPISKGGSNTARNIELLCEKCNRSKSNNVV